MISVPAYPLALILEAPQPHGGDFVRSLAKGVLRRYGWRLVVSAALAQMRVFLTDALFRTRPVIDEEFSRRVPERAKLEAMAVGVHFADYLHGCPSMGRVIEIARVSIARRLGAAGDQRLDDFDDSGELAVGKRLDEAVRPCPGNFDFPRRQKATWAIADHAPIDDVHALSQMSYTQNTFV
jgi:hypothetical protein